MKNEPGAQMPDTFHIPVSVLELREQMMVPPFIVFLYPTLHVKLHSPPDPYVAAFVSQIGLDAFAIVGSGELHVTAI